MMVLLIMTIQELNELLVEHIAAMVGEGYICGYDPYWSIEFEPGLTDSGDVNTALVHIVRMIKEGYTCGYHPTWALTIQFPRLLAEILAAGLSMKQYDELLDSMNLQASQLNELFDRATEKWEADKKSALIVGQAYYKTTYKVEVLSEERLDCDSLATIAYEIIEGDCSGSLEEVSVQQLTADEAREALIAQGSDPGFFQSLSEDDEESDEAGDEDIDG